MIIGKVEQAIVMEIYDAEGKYLGKQAKYVYKPILIWRDVIIGLIVAFLAFTQMV